MSLSKEKVRLLVAQNEVWFQSLSLSHQLEDMKAVLSANVLEPFELGDEVSLIYGDKSIFSGYIKQLHQSGTPNSLGFGIEASSFSQKLFEGLLTMSVPPIPLLEVLKIFCAIHNIDLIVSKEASFVANLPVVQKNPYITQDNQEKGSKDQLLNTQDLKKYATTLTHQTGLSLNNETLGELMSELCQNAGLVLLPDKGRSLFLDLKGGSSFAPQEIPKELVESWSLRKEDPVATDLKSSLFSGDQLASMKSKDGLDFSFFKINSILSSLNQKECIPKTENKSQSSTFDKSYFGEAYHLLSFKNKIDQMLMTQQMNISCSSWGDEDIWKPNRCYKVPMVASGSWLLTTVSFSLNQSGFKSQLTLKKRADLPSSLKNISL